MKCEKNINKKYTYYSLIKKTFFFFAKSLSAKEEKRFPLHFSLCIGCDENNIKNGAVYHHKIFFNSNNPYPVYLLFTRH
jgi:hypothetical protein